MGLRGSNPTRASKISSFFPITYQHPAGHLYAPNQLSIEVERLNAPYSLRNATTGSTFEARRAGIRQASNPAADKIKMLTARLGASIGAV
jgi:hypothetical protein